jgi:hypothetical protein
MKEYLEYVFPVVVAGKRCIPMLLFCLLDLGRVNKNMP